MPGDLKLALRSRRGEVRPPFRRDGPRPSSRRVWIARSVRWGGRSRGGDRRRALCAPVGALSCSGWGPALRAAEAPRGGRLSPNGRLSVAYRSRTRRRSSSPDLYTAAPIRPNLQSRVHLFLPPHPHRDERGRSGALKFFRPTRNKKVVHIRCAQGPRRFAHVLHRVIHRAVCASESPSIAWGPAHRTTAPSSIGGDAMSAVRGGLCSIGERMPRHPQIGSALFARAPHGHARRG